MTLRFFLLIHFIVFSGSLFGQKFCRLMNYQSIQATETEDGRKDSIDILHYSLDLDARGDENKFLSGKAVITLVNQVETDQFRFDLEGLTVDSASVYSSASDRSEPATIVHNGRTLLISTLNTISGGDTVSVTIDYAGNPIKDASWGGFYYSGVYSYNLGVAFTSSPHNYGRVWFPCVDNFTDRATYSFYVVTDEEDHALCNGLLVDSGSLPDKSKFYSYFLNDPIPTYLASIAVAPYAVMHQNHHDIPVTLAALPGDTADMRSSFIHLDSCIGSFIQAYGPHRFDRIGFNIVPFNGGAMEHATNIAYPKFGIANGGLTYETLYAHELAHHWWGNNITCSSAEDMWINEGWASFSERVFLEGVYGIEAYRSAVADNHLAVVRYAHLRDGKALPVSGIGHSNTYGMHVYDKGADVAHTLRGYMGDSAFFTAIRSFMETHEYSAVSSKDMMDHFQQFTNRDLETFFDQWVYQPGFPAFYVFSYELAGNSLQLRTKQDLRLAPDYFRKVPYTIALYDQNGKEERHQLLLSGPDQTHEITTQLSDVSMVILDPDQLISDAITVDSDDLGSNQSYDWSHALINVETGNLPQSTFVRIEHRWVSPDHYYQRNKKLRMSRERYWVVDGQFKQSLEGKLTFNYNGLETGTNYGDGYLDVDLITGSEDSLVLLYRENAWSDWQLHPDYELDVIISPTNKIGKIIANGIRKGQYALGIYDASGTLYVGDKNRNYRPELSVYPNPADSNVHINVKNELSGSGVIEMFRSDGSLLFEKRVKGNHSALDINVSELASGYYYIGFAGTNCPYVVKKIYVR